MVNGPDEYPWTSHNAYLGKEILPWLTDWMLGQFGKSVRKARMAYQTFVLDSLTCNLGSLTPDFDLYFMCFMSVK
jgi:hypothetical protein